MRWSSAKMKDREVAVGGREGEKGTAVRERE